MLAIALWILLCVTLCHSSTIPSSGQPSGPGNAPHIHPRGSQSAPAVYVPDKSHGGGYLRMPLSRNVVNVSESTERRRRGHNGVRPVSRRQDMGWGWSHLEDLRSGIAYAIERQFPHYSSTSAARKKKLT